MKFFAVIFLVGFALASAIPAPSHELSLDDADDLDLLLDFALETEGDDETKTELREKFNEILEKIKVALEKGKEVKQDLLDKLKEARQKLKDRKIDIGNKARDLLEKIREKAKDYWKNIFDKLRPQESARLSERSEILEEFVKTLKYALDKHLEWFKKILESGEDIPEKPINKLKELLKKLKVFGLDINDKLRKFIETLHGKAKEKFQAILDTLLKDREIAFAEEDDDVANLREKIGVFLRKVKEAIENDEKLNVEEISRQIVEQYLKLKNKGIELSEKDHDLIRLMGQKIKEYFQKQLEKIGKKERSISEFKERLRELKEKIKGKFDVGAIKEGIENIFGKGSELAEKLINLVKDKGENAKQKILDFIERHLKEQEDKRSIQDVYEKVKEYLRNIKIELKEKFSKFGEWAVAQYEKGLEKGKDRAENLKKLAKEFMNKATDMSRDVIEEAKGFFKEYKDDLGIVYEDFIAKMKEIVKS